MTRKKHHYDPSKVHGNFGPGGFSDQFDNEKFRSVDRDQHRGGVTGIHIEDDMALKDMNFSPQKGERFYQDYDDRHEPDRDADLSHGSAGTSWNQGLNEQRNYSGVGPKGWKLSDEKLREKVSEVLLHSHDVDPSGLEVTVEDSIVYLQGTIQSKGMRIVAEDLVASIPGVEDVFTELRIEDSYRLSPEAYNEAIQTDRT